MRADLSERPWQGWPDIDGAGFARAFGDSAQDLDVDFLHAARAELVSRLLQDCLRCESARWNRDDVWSWTLAQRLQGLLAIALAGNAPSFELTQPCHECNEMLELHIDPFAFERVEQARRFTWSVELQDVDITLPTGREQLAWAHADGLTMRSMARQLVHTVDGHAPESHWEIPAAWVESLGEELEKHDPLTGLDIASQCPACGAAASLAFDLEAHLLGHFHARQRRTLAEIHRLASAYHWSEAAILDLPAWRRHHYLAQLAAAGNA